MTTRPLLRRALYIAALAMLLDLAFNGATSAVTGQQHIGGRNMDAASSAQPTAAMPKVTDQSYLIRYSDKPSIKGDAVATSAAGCDGCEGSANTVQVLYLTGTRLARVDNVATAWSRCNNCRSKAVSVQLVLLSGDATLVANNRSLAENFECSGCKTVAAAYQVVLQHVAAAPSASLRQQLQDWAARQDASLNAGTGPVGKADRVRANRVAGNGLASLQSLVAGHTGGTVVRKSATVRLAGPTR
jgi:hypothetical protein